jgi:beta-xylosidase
MTKIFITICSVFLLFTTTLFSQNFKNPILHLDYSDPSVTKVGDEFYMTASSFNCIPGLPILHSTDLVNWTLISHALPYEQIPVDLFDKPGHGLGVWAPAIRHHNNLFYIYWGDPDHGIYVVTSKDAITWSKPLMIKEGKGLIDPAPFWDDDGKAYLVYALAGSRATIKSVLMMADMAPDG